MTNNTLLFPSRTAPLFHSPHFTKFSNGQPRKRPVWHGLYKTLKAAKEGSVI